jgi:hypothetical protein
MNIPRKKNKKSGRMGFARCLGCVGYIRRNGVVSLKLAWRVGGRTCVTMHLESRIKEVMGPHRFRRMMEVFWRMVEERQNRGFCRYKCTHAEMMCALALLKLKWHRQ